MMKVTTFYHYSEHSKLDSVDLSVLCNGNSYGDDFKPSGLWLSYDEDKYGWADWCIAERFRLESLTYRYKVCVSMSDVLVIDSYDKLVDFTRKYQPASDAPFQDHMKWNAVKRSYKGIAFIPYVRMWYHDMMRTDVGISALWYSAVDCESACVWDSSAITYFGPAIKTGY